MRLYQILISGNPTLAIEEPGGRFVPVEDILNMPCSNYTEFLSYGKDVWRGFIKEFNRKLTDCHSFYRDEVMIFSPIEGGIRDIICLAENYSKADVTIPNEGVNTVYFSKRFVHAVGDGELIPSYSELTKKLDYETELLVIIGEDVRDVSENEAMQSVFGYSVINDISARDLQAKHKQWYRGKSLDGFTVVGPCIVTADEIADVHSLEICTQVNGVVRQKSNTGCMIKKIGTVIAELSTGMTLPAGTLIATGTPYGCGKDLEPPQFLQSGDVIKSYIEAIGTLNNTVN